MGLKTQNLRSWSVHKFTVAVLWMEGRLRTAEIARQVGWTAGQVRGFYAREFHPPRDVLTRDDRQKILDHLKASREWFGVFIDKRFDDRFRAKELSFEHRSRMAMEARQRAAEDQKPPTKKELRRIAQETAQQKRQAEREKAARERGFAPRGAEMDAISWLYANALGDRNEQIARGSLMSRDRRKEALLKFRGHLAGRAINPLQAQDYEAVHGAGGAKIALPEYRKYCIDIVGGIRLMVSSDEFAMIEAIVDRDEFMWLSAKQGSARGKVYEAIRRASDLLAVFYQMMSRDDYLLRWGDFPPISSLPSRAAAREDSARMQEVIDTLSRAVA